MCYLSNCYLDLIGILTSTFTNFIVAFFFSKIFNPRKESKYYMWKYFGIMFSLYLISRLHPFLYENRALLMWISFFFSAFYLSKDKWYKKILVVVTLLLFLFIIDVPQSMIVFSKHGYSFSEVNAMLDEEYFRLFDLLFSEPRTLALNGLNNVVLTFFGVTMMMILRKETRHFYVWLICFVISLLTISNLYFAYFYLDEGLSLVVLLVCQVIAIVLLIYIVEKMSIHFKYDKSVEENKFLKEKMLMQLSYYEMMKNREEEVRKINHDIKNNLQVMYSLDDISKRKDMIEKISSNLDKHYMKKYSTQDILNVVLNIKVNEALKNNIKIDVVVKKKLDFMEDMDVSNLITNILDNAIEGSTKADLKEINFLVKKKMNYVIIECENTFNGEIKINKKKQLITSKNGDHGYGSKIIKSVVNKYNGEVNYEINDNKFKLTILFENTEK